MNTLKTGRDPPQTDKTKDIVFPGQNEKETPPDFLPLHGYNKSDGKIIFTFYV